MEANKEHKRVFYIDVPELTPEQQNKCVMDLIRTFKDKTISLENFNKGN